MSERKYRLEMTAEELLAYAAQCEAVAPLAEQMRAAIAQAKADREDDDMRLPWRAWSDSQRGWYMAGVGSTQLWAAPSERAAKLASAAPELLEAVRAARHFWAARHERDWLQWERDVHPLVERALRKVELGQPEPL